MWFSNIKLARVSVGVGAWGAIKHLDNRDPISQGFFPRIRK